MVGGLSVLSDPIRLIVADGRSVVREGLRLLLESEGFSVVAQAADGQAALHLVRRHQPNVLLLSTSLPGLDASTLSAIAGSTAPLLVADALTENHLISALENGARGMLPAEACPSLLSKAVRVVHQGQYWVGRDVVSDLVRHIRNHRTAAPGAHTVHLTPREREVLLGLSEGLSNKEIANLLHTREDTVKHHLTNIYDKLGVSSRLEAVLFAHHHQLLQSASESA